MLKFEKVNKIQILRQIFNHKCSFCHENGTKTNTAIRCIQGLALAISSRRLMTVGLCCQCAKKP